MKHRQEVKIKPFTPAQMADGLVKKHGIENAARLADGLAISNFNDAQGQAVVKNETATYWAHVRNLIMKKSKGANVNGLKNISN